MTEVTAGCAGRKETGRVPQDYFSEATEVVPGTCFVLMPFSEAMRPVYETIAHALASSEVAFTCQRADELFGGGHIIRDVLRGIAGADLVIADVTSRNPNVFYELEIAHTTKSIERVLIITQSMNDVPFDLQQFRCSVYQPTEQGLQQLKQSVIETVKRLSAGVFRFSVQDGARHHFTKKLFGDGDFLYDFELRSQSGFNSAKVVIDILRYDATSQPGNIDRVELGMQVGQSRRIPYIPWNLHLERSDHGTSIFSVRQLPAAGAGPLPIIRSSPKAGGTPWVVRSAEYQEYVVRALDTGTIEVLQSGAPVLPAKPALRELARRLGIDLVNRNGKALNTRQLGDRIIRSIIDRQHP